MRRKFSFSTGEYYHLYNRGTDKREIFTTAHDYNRFVALLYMCNSIKAVDTNVHFQEGRSFLDFFDTERGETLVDIGAYCLMPNHFHLLIREKQENGISLFMKKLSTGYSMYFNKKNERSGALFEGRFKAKHANTDEYLKYLFAYIHLNPIKIIDSNWKEAGVTDRVAAKEYLAEYAYSSYLEYLGVIRKEQKIIEKGAFPEYFKESQSFEHFINDWITFKD